MKLKLVYERSSGRSADIVVTVDPAALVGEVADGIARVDPTFQGGPAEGLTLSVSPPGRAEFTTLEASRPVGEAALASGFSIRLIRADAAPRAAVGGRASAVVRVIAGPASGQEFALANGSYTIGRDPSADVVINDPMVSKRHARLDVNGQLDLIDLNSANGLLVDGGLVTRLTVQPGQPVTLGDSVLSFVRTERERASRVEARIVGGGIPFNRSPQVVQRYPERRHPRPLAPGEPDPPMFAWIMLVAPIAMGVSMYFITGRVMSLLFVAMAPMMMTGNYVNNRRKNKRQLKSELAKFDAQVAQLEATLAEETRVETVARRLEVPSVAEVLASGLHADPGLWTRRPEHWSFLALRLGTASLPSRNQIAPPPEIDESIPELAQQVADLEARYRLVDSVPLVELAPLAGAIGVVGGVAPDVARGLLVELTGLHSPAELVVAAFAGPAARADWEWLRWLPHTSSPQSPITGAHLVDTQPSATNLLSELERIVADRLERRVDDPAETLGPLPSDLQATAIPGQLGESDLGPPPPLPVVVLVVTEDAPVDRARLVQVASRAASAGIVPIWLAKSTDGLPAVCRTFVDVESGLTSGRVHFVRHGSVVEGVEIDGVGKVDAEAFARSLAPLFDAGAVAADSTDLPSTVSMVTLLGDELADSSDAVVERWHQNLSVNERTGRSVSRARAGTLRALVGQMGADAMHLDLRTHGPHALVGGTTGAGKSEFLQAWVLGMAAEYSPDRVTFLFVDYKGGAAFAECVRLPHCVGLVTDLSPHLVRRALTSLRAELHHREHLLNRKKAKDLLELEKRGDPEAPPALVLVIDEFAALSKDVPDFVDGVVDLAQRGRSLGIHLIMATQRPAGVIKDNLRANTNLRIALRMADESDSSDVIGTAVAAHFDPGIPGRAVAKSGPGRLTPFQSAYAGGHTTGEESAAEVLVQTLRFGAPEAWQDSSPEPVAVPEDPGPTDQVRLVESIISAARTAGVPAPRKPWLDELRPAYDLARLGPRTDTELILGLADLPDKQAQNVVQFIPDIDGNLAVYGTGGSGKSVLLRTLAIGAGITPRGGPVRVYGLDFAAGGLKILEPLPNVGAIVSGEDHERVTRLIRTIREVADERSRTFPLVNAGNIVEYRRLAGRPDEPRILILVDNFPAFRDAYEVAGPRQATYATLQQLLSEGRALGIHVVFTADRPASVPGSVAASVPRRVVLRLAEESGYMVLGVAPDILDAASPPGRAIIDGLESQIAIFGGSGNVADQSKAIADIARAMLDQGISPAPAIDALPTEVAISSLPSELDGLPVLGLSDDTLAPISFEPHGTFLIGGGPGSGRTNALVALAQSLRRWEPDIVLVYFGLRRSAVPGLVPWDIVATTPEDVGLAAKQLSEAFTGATRKKHTAVFIEGVADLVQTPADAPVVELIRAIKRSDHLVVADSETSGWSSVYPIFAEIRNGRRGLLLQPDFMEGDAILRTPFPRANRSEFPPGRGMAVLHGRAVKVQLPLADRVVLPIPNHPAQP